MRARPWVQKRVTSGGKVRYTGVYYTLDGKSHSAGTYSAKKAARQAAEEMQAAVRESRWRDPRRGSITLRDYVEQVWRPNKVIEPSSGEAYDTYLNNRILPTLGDTLLSALLPTDVQAWVKAQTRDVSPGTVAKMHALLSGICKNAVRNRIIDANPCQGTDLPVVPKRSVTVLSPEQFTRLAETALPEHWLMLQTAVETGTRWGELVAFRADQLNLLHQEIVVNRATMQVAAAKNGGQRFLDKEYPKDREPRRIAIPEWLAEALQTHITERALAPGDRLFANRAGGPLDRNNFRRHWNERLAAAGLPKVSFQASALDVRVVGAGRRRQRHPRAEEHGSRTARNDAALQRGAASFGSCDRDGDREGAWRPASTSNGARPVTLRTRSCHWLIEVSRSVVKSITLTRSRLPHRLTVTCP
jgi:integrase